MEKIALRICGGNGYGNGENVGNERIIFSEVGE